jgi:hypothetical protein
MTSNEGRVTGFYTCLCGSDRETIYCFEATLTIEEWKAEEANCLSSSFLSTLFLP